jgi:hypothetical protein
MAFELIKTPFSLICVSVGVHSCTHAVAQIVKERSDVRGGVWVHHKPASGFHALYEIPIVPRASLVLLFSSAMLLTLAPLPYVAKTLAVVLAITVVHVIVPVSLVLRAVSEGLDSETAAVVV